MAVGAKFGAQIGRNGDNCARRSVSRSALATAKPRALRAAAGFAVGGQTALGDLSTGGARTLLGEIK
jgi:hypothetical protein